MELVQRLALSNGAEARLFRDGIGWRFELQQGDRLYADRFDPRDDDRTLVVAPTRWSEPDGEPMPDDLHDAVIDAFWALAAETKGIARILEWRPELLCNVARRWKLPSSPGEPGGIAAGAFLVRVADPPKVVEYLELGRTAWLPYAAPTERVAKIDPGGARWKYPADAPMDGADAARVIARLRAAAPDDMVLSERGWTIA